MKNTESLLTKQQRDALEYVAAQARSRIETAGSTIAHVLRMSNVSVETYETALAKIKTSARVALHFHPDRPDSNMKTVAESLLECGSYLSQFATQISNGSVSAFAGGERDKWEQKMFGGAYHCEGVENHHRPKYGALDIMLHDDGPAPRFGSCYFLLHPEVSQRCTFTYLDSHRDPVEKGTLADFQDIMAAILSEIFERDFAIGENSLTVTRFFAHILNRLGVPFFERGGNRFARNLNHYIEAQVHGEVNLAKDVATLVADASFKGTKVGEILDTLCQKNAIDLRWHEGFALAIYDVPSDFRGPSMPSLARRVAPDGLLTTHKIGEAVVDVKQNPANWTDRGAIPDVVQELKLLWHVLLKFGKPV